MNERVLRVLEFDKIREKLIHHAQTAMGKERAAVLLPTFAYGEVLERQRETEEGLTAERLRGQLPLGGIRDIRAAVKRAALGAALSARELLDVADTIRAGRRLKKWIMSLVEEGKAELPILLRCAERIADFRPLEEEIRACIDDSGEISDQASPELRRIRIALRNAQGRVKSQLEGMIRSAFYQKMLQDPIITIRNDRFCLPVKAEYRSAMGGIVHDQSASGATLFIEPEAIVQLNNQIREWELKEQREMERILARLTALVQAEAETVETTLAALADIDFIAAKASLAREMKATRPELNEEGKIVLRRARHPLLDPRRTVPIDIHLGEPYTLLVITGPNTGGKTVTLKTVGLLTLMAMAGLQLPVEEGSEISVFQHVFADIGDEQSIEQNLSTFSSHMTHIIQILKEVDDRSLVLFDELGAGTDPTEGAALAMAILDELAARGARSIATTHYSELKAYAYHNSHAINASMEFDVESLRPTYRLLIGVPGSSNAFAISERLGLPSRIIAAAKAKMTAQDVRVEDLIRQLEQNRRRAEQERQEAERLKKEWKAELASLDQEKERFFQQRDRLLNQAEEEARALVAQAEREADEILQQLRRMQRESGPLLKEHELINLKKRLEEAVPSSRRERRLLRKAAEQQAIQPGDTVLVLPFQQKGTVLQVHGQEALVQIGAMKSKVKKEQLQWVAKQEKQQPVRPVITRQGEGAGERPQLELDLRGKTVEEAVLEIDRFLDHAVLQGYTNVSLIHGKGTGALRAGVQEYLRRHPQVRSFRMGSQGEGGSGVTIVTLK